MLQGASRFLVELVRLNDEVVVGLTQAQLWSLALVVLGAVLAYRTSRSQGGLRLSAAPVG